MKKVIYAVAFATLLAAPAIAGTYVDALRQCGQEWRASDARKQVKKGEGTAAWNTFRAECVKRVGYESKRRSAQAPTKD